MNDDGAGGWKYLKKHHLKYLEQMNRPLDQEILPDLLVIFSRVYKVDQDISENSLKTPGISINDLLLEYIQQTMV